MSNVVNLNKFRKAKAKADKGETAKENRRKHGRTKGEKEAEKAEKERLDTFLEGKDLTDPEDKDPA